MLVNALASPGDCRARVPRTLSCRSGAARPPLTDLRQDVPIFRSHWWLDGVQGLLAVANRGAQDNKVIFDELVHEGRVPGPALLVPGSAARSPSMGHGLGAPRNWPCPQRTSHHRHSWLPQRGDHVDHLNVRSCRVPVRWRVMARGGGRGQWLAWVACRLKVRVDSVTCRAWGGHWRDRQGG